MKRKLLFGLAGFVVTLGVVAWVFRDNYLFLWDAYDHHGLFRCAVRRTDDSGVVRECIAGVDEPLLAEFPHPNGAIEQRWYANTQEVLRITTTSGGRSNTVYRQHADCWAHMQDSQSAPEGRSGIPCR